MPDAGILATMLLVLGLFLLGLEFFVPSFGMILAIAVISLIVSFWSASKAWWGVNPGFFWTYVILLVAGIPGTLLGAITLMQKTSLGNRLILRPPPPFERTTSNPLDELIGQRGTAQTLLTPGGMVMIKSERFHAESLGMLIEPQTPVIVVTTRANRIVVRPWTAEDDPTSQREATAPADPELSDENPFADDPTSQRVAMAPLPVVDPEEPDAAATFRNSPIASQPTLPLQGNENRDRLDFEIPDD